jgi:hypothetical protein
VVLKLHGTHQLQIYADDVNLQDTQTLIDASKEVGLEVNTEKTKYMLLSRHQNAGQNHDLNVGNIFLKCGTVQISGNDYNKLKLILEKI